MTIAVILFFLLGLFTGARDELSKAPLVLIGILAPFMVFHLTKVWGRRISPIRLSGSGLAWSPEAGWSGRFTGLKNPGRLAKSIISRGYSLDAIQLVSATDAWNQIGTTDLRKMFRAARQNGNLLTSLNILEIIAARTNSLPDGRLRDLLKSELEVMGGSRFSFGTSKELHLDPKPGSVLHVVGKTILDDQNGYTIRTHELCRAQQMTGLNVSVVGQMGFFNTNGLDRWEETRDGVNYIGFFGPKRNEVPMGDWVDESILNLTKVVEEVEPSVIHAHSDFLNAGVAHAVSARFGVPMVYEVRGFWEETLLTNLSQRNQWPSLDRHIERYGLPEAYALRREIEKKMRNHADAIVTLDASMANFIRREDGERHRIVVVPNAISRSQASDDAVTLEELNHLRLELGLPPDLRLVGLASSLVPYEGIDVLIDALKDLGQLDLGMSVGLLVLGDGPARKGLEERARASGIKFAVFQGKVPNREVKRYLSLLDVAVFPRISTPVTERVQPLKPVEAMGLGRPVVVSSVAPLRNLADETQLVRVFEAGNSADLARVLAELLEDPILRADLGSRGRNWVLEHRTWELNAINYTELYESIFPGFRNERPTLDVTGVAEGVVPLENFPRVTEPRIDEELPPRIYRLRNFSPVNLEEIDWLTAGMEARTFGWHLHAWDFMDSTLRRFQESEEIDLLHWCWRIAHSWVKNFGDGASRETMAFYDMSIAARSVRLGFLVQSAISTGVFKESEIADMLSAVTLHAELLLDPSNFSGWNNHGLYSALSGKALSRRFPGASWSKSLGEISDVRLHELLSQQFLPDGGHVEHSFDYHRMVLQTVIYGVGDGLISTASIPFPLNAATEALEWMVRPDGFIEQVGDTPQHLVRMPVVAPLESGGQVSTSSKSDGGIPRTFGVKILPRTGFLFIRDLSKGKGKSTSDSTSYVTFSGSFHSRTHKHADDLSVTWFDLGREILIDSGRFGYGKQLDPKDPLRTLAGFYYDSRERQYVESTMAHNTVEADGRMHDRVGRDPYGAAQFHYHRTSDVHHASAEVNHGSWTHRRSISLRPGSHLDFKDWLTGHDGQPHLFRQWFNLPGDLKLIDTGRGLVVFQGGDDIFLTIKNREAADLIAPARNETSPQIRGVRSKQDGELEPAWNFAFEVNALSGSLNTSISLVIRGGNQ